MHVVAIVASLLLAAAGAPSRGIAADASGAIYVVTLPAAADVWVDGAYVGRTPVLVDGLPGGRHMITAAKTGWETREVDVKVGASPAFQFVDFALDRSAHAPRASGKIALHVAQRFEAPTVDGIAVKPAADGTLEVPTGPHEIALRLGGRRLVRHVFVYAGTTTNVVVREGSTNDERAAVVAPVNTYLPPSDVVVDGRRITIRHNGHRVAATLGEAEMSIDGAPVSFETPPAIVEGKLYLPLEVYVRIGALSPRLR